MDNLTYDKSRVINFSDAIFSIAMTLLVLEVGIPSLKGIANNTIWTILHSRLPSFIGLVVSFFVSAIYWVAHLRHMKYVSDVDGKLLWLNIILMFFIVLLPFSTGFYVVGINYNGPFVFYCFNLSAIGLFNYLIINYIFKKEKGQTGLTPLLGKWHKAVALNSFLIWVIAGAIVFMLPILARVLFLVIFIFEIFINKYFRKKVKQEASM
jgi:TMEM175 potassium channel family protein